MTQLALARKGTISPQMRLVAEKEGLEPKAIRRGVAEGTMVIPANPRHINLNPCGIGKGLSTKVNANIGTSSDYGTLETELHKVQVCLEYKADTVMDLSTGGDIGAIRQAIMASCPLPIGTVPIYQAGIEAVERRGAIVDMTPDDLFAVIEQQAEDWVSFMTLHCGVTQSAISRLRTQ